MIRSKFPQRNIPNFSLTMNQGHLYFFLAIVAGIAIAILPVKYAIALIGGVTLLLIMLMEPAAGLIVMLCVAPLKTLIETELLVLPVDVGQITLTAFVGFWILRRVADRRKTIKFPLPLMIALIIFILGASLSLWTAYAARPAIMELLKWIEMLILIVLVANTDRWQWALFGLGLSAALQAIIGIWEFQGGSGAAHLWILDYRFFRAFGTFGQPNPFGAFMGIILPLTLGTAAGYLWQAYSQAKSRNENLLIGVIYGGLSSIILGGLLVSWSRGAWIGFLGASAAMIWSFPRSRWQGHLAVFGGGFLIIMLWSTGLLPAGITARLTGFTQGFTGFGDVRGIVISDENFAVVERLAHWQSAIEMAKSSPWLGVGFGNYETAYPHFALINWPHALGHAHNYYLNLMAETGIIGLLTYLLMWGLIIRLTWQQIRIQQDWRWRGIIAGLMGIWTHILIHSLLDKLYVNNLFLHIGVMLGLLAVIKSATIKMQEV